jgi:nicotinamide-nucleotide amidase
MSPGQYNFGESRELFRIMEAEVGKALLKKELTVGLGESCTGGLVGHLITQVAGSSDYFRGGIIAYSNQAKMRLLGVASETLEHHGAVSEETAIEMARGARAALKADLGISVTGVAGPGGGTPEKPVGLTWIGFSSTEDEFAERFVWEGTREENKSASAQAALTVLLGQITGPIDG